MCGRMKESFEFPVEEMPLASILRDCVSNEELLSLLGG